MVFSSKYGVLGSFGCTLGPTIIGSSHIKIVWQTTTEMCDENYVVEYHMTFHSFNVLCDLLKPYAQANTTNWRKPIEFEKVVVAVLKRLVSKASNEVISSQYGIGESMLMKYTLFIIDA